MKSLKIRNTTLHNGQNNEKTQMRWTAKIAIKFGDGSIIKGNIADLGDGSFAHDGFFGSRSEMFHFKK